MKELTHARWAGIRANSRRPNLLAFTTPWCRYCNMLKPHLKELEKKHRNINFYSVDGDKEQAFCEELGVTSFPTVAVFNRKGSEVGRSIGFEEKDTIGTIEGLMGRAFKV